MNICSRRRIENWGGGSKTGPFPRLMVGGKVMKREVGLGVGDLVGLRRADEARWRPQ